MEEQIKLLQKQVEKQDEELSDLRIKITDMTAGFEEIIYTAKQQL